MKYAFAYGADAVYMGIPDFSLRVRINQFTIEQIHEAIDYTHNLEKKIYVTVNIVAHNKHLKKLPTYLKKLNTWKPDGFIVSDPGVMELVKKYAPRIPIHLSTQANATNWQTVKFWYEQGISRVILGREVTLEEIKEIYNRVKGVELEYFIHGAMCMSYSGRCMLSAWLTGRSANLGDCAQPCRWKFDIGSCKLGYIEAEVEEPLRPNMKIPVEEDTHGTYIFNSKDLCLIEFIPELIKAGVTSFKIEGRAKSVAYLASVVKAYREAFDYTLHNNKNNKQKLRLIKQNALEKLVHRGYTTGFLFGRDSVEQNVDNSHVGGGEEFVGEVMSCGKFGKKYKIVVRPHNALRVGDKVRIIQPGCQDLRVVIKKMYNEHGQELESGHGGGNKNVVLEVNKEVGEFGILFKKL